MSTARDMTESLEAYVDDLVASGYGLDAITDELERLAALTDEEFAALPRDGSGRITLDQGESAAPGARPYFNIRDRAQGNATAAQRIAEWALGKVRKARERLAAVDATAAARIADIEAWRQSQLKGATREDEFFTGVLDQYHADFADGERTITLPGGKLKLTKNRDTIAWEEAAALAWAAAQPDADRLAPRKLARSVVKDTLTKRADGTFCTADGEHVEWVRMVPPAAPDTFSVELS